ncbi:ADP-ribosyltransferase [Legionella quateirensis]|uniref:ADP-ribosyltransferase exoenzyme n=1 Tax=Legionella quateirensis TaxID=45072 RepID=A0A378KP19_9GAMM|nr:ADP-ribosyltransferase [Legionella quateirensis]KTD44826.1 ADP-ribosyltransferase exoenzyme [Legionella quateirensis]STY16285.1 ADP-ribosyltransferase exoenzyme [Legionella quateirensis]
MGLSEDFVQQNPELIKKLTNVGIVQEHIEYGPLNKNPYTYAFEHLVSAFLAHQAGNSKDPVTFEVKDEILYATYQNEIFDMSEILRFANMNHLSLSKETAAHYEKFITSGLSMEKPGLPDLEGIPTNNDYIEREKSSTKPDAVNHLNWSEKSAINIYSGGFYVPCNSLLRGSTGPISSFDSRQLGETLSHIAFVSSGLNQISETLPLHTFRSEEKFSEDYIDERIKAVENGGQVTQEMAFISTSHDKVDSEFMRAMTQEGIDIGVMTGIVYSNVVGKYISSISKKPDELEYLIPPTQMQWIGYDKNPNGGCIFHAQPVSSLTGLSDKQSRGLDAEHPAVKSSNSGFYTKMIKEQLAAIKETNPDNAPVDDTSHSSTPQNR